MENSLENDVLMLMPCAVKIPLEEQISKVIKKAGADGKVKYCVLSNAVMQENVFEKIGNANSINDMPDIMLAPGFSRFFYKTFVEKYRNKGCFHSVCEFEANKIFRGLNITDPQGYYDVVAFNPLVMLVDKTRNKKLKTPEKWGDLLSEEYENSVAFRGKDDSNYCEGVLLTIYKEFGYKGIEKLAKTVKMRLHPAEMVKMAGKKDAPDISIIPLSFARLVKQSEDIQIVCPKDGAIVNPIVMLTKKNCSDYIKNIAKYIMSDEACDTLMSAGFYSINPNYNEKIESEFTYNWVGWDFVINNDTGLLIKELNEIMKSIIDRRKR